MDKVGHFLMYGGLSAIFCWTFHRKNRNALIYYSTIILLCFGYGILMEILQGLIHGLDRSFSPADAVANLAGICIFIPLKEHFLPSRPDDLECE